MKTIVTGAPESQGIGEKQKAGTEIPKAAGKSSRFESEIKEAEIYFKVLREIEFITLRI